MPLPKFPPENFPKPPRISKIIKKANPLREVIEDAREVIKDVRTEISEVAGAIRVKPPEEKPKQESEECPVCSDLANLKEYLGKRKVQKALSQLEKGEGNKKSLETVKKYIEGEEID